MVRLSLRKGEAEFLHSGMTYGIRGLDQESYPRFIKDLESIKTKLEKQGITEEKYGIQ